LSKHFYQHIQFDSQTNGYQFSAKLIFFNYRQSNVPLNK